jgi:hypothetical protein
VLVSSAVEADCVGGSGIGTEFCEGVSAYSHANWTATHQPSSTDNRTAKDFSNSDCGRRLNELIFGHM